jgi:hypothetical protein
MKISARSFRKAKLLLLLTALGFPSILRAQTPIILDQFDRSGSLDGSAPTYDVGSGTWTAPSYYNNVGTSDNLANPAAANDNTGDTAYISIPNQYIDPGTGSLLTGINYQLTLTAAITATSDPNGGTVGIAFGNCSDINAPIAPPNVMGAAMITDSNSTNLVESYYGENGASAADVNRTTTAPPFIPTQLTVDLNTTGTYWTEETFENGTPISYDGTPGDFVYTFSTPGNPYTSPITDVAIWNYRNVDANLTGFELSVAPEPSTWMLIGAGLLIFGWLVRRRKSLS